jgi:hypothetical protein
MKKVAVIMIAGLSFLKANACDICGCGVGGNYIGILPEFHQHVFGLRYRFNSLTTHIGTGGNATYLTTEEKYQTIEAWGGWNIGKKFRVMAAVPYAFNEKSNQGISNRKNGIGDISVNAYYRLFNTQKTIPGGKTLVQTLWAGAGIKLPSGKYTDADKQNTSQNTNLFQLGTGSTDFTLNAMYDIQWQNAGLNISGSYKMNSDNKYNYNYGNKLNTSVQAYYKFRVKDKLTIAPNAGMVYENSKKDIDNEIMVDISGGNLLQGSIGVETAFEKISVGVNWQTPLSQNLADGFVKANSRVMLHFSFIL